MLSHHSAALPGAKSVPNLTDLAIRSAHKGATLWDAAIPGFGLRVGTASKTFIVLIDSGRRQKIGRYPLISLQDARSEAKRLLAEKDLGTCAPALPGVF